MALGCVFCVSFQATPFSLAEKSPLNIETIEFFEWAKNLSLTCFPDGLQKAH